MKRVSNSKTYLILPIILILAFVNPVVEEIMFNQEGVFMASHYALAFAGGVIGFTTSPGRTILLILVHF